MLAVSILYLSVIISGIISSILFLIMLGKTTTRLPEVWRKATSVKNFRLSIYFLTIFLSLAFINEIITSYLTRQGVLNGYVFSIYFTIVPLPLFGFFFIHTKSKWKRYGYIVLHSILIGYLINGGYYHPLSNHPTTTSLLLNSIFFLVALLYLTDLLVHPKTDNFKFKLKICLVVLVFALMATILTSFHWSDITSDHVVNFHFIFLLQMGNMILFYFSFTGIFISEIIKLRRG